MANEQTATATDTAPRKPEAQKTAKSGLSWLQKVTGVNLADRIEAFAYKHPYVATAVVVGAVGLAFSFALGVPALAAGAQTLATTFGLAAEFGAVTAVMGAGLHAAKNTAFRNSSRNMLLPSGQVVQATARLCGEISAKQRQFDRISLRRDFNVKSELTARDVTVLKAYEAMWASNRVESWLEQRLPADSLSKGILAGKPEVIKLVGNVEVASISDSAATVAAFLKDNLSRDLCVPKLNTTLRAYDDAEAAASKKPEMTVNFGRKLQLVSKLV